MTDNKGTSMRKFLFRPLRGPENGQVNVVLRKSILRKIGPPQGVLQGKYVGSSSATSDQFAYLVFKASPGFTTSELTNFI